MSSSNPPNGASSQPTADPAAPPPTYAPTQPQILIAPLPDASSFFWGRTIQGEVFIKGLGEHRTRTVKSLSVSARLTDRLPGHPVNDLLDIPAQTLYPLAEPQAGTSVQTETAFPTSLRFALPLPAALADGSPLPGTLNLGAGGEVRWEVQVRLALLSDEVITERVTVEGTPPDVCTDQTEEEPLEAESVLERDGVRVRLVLACSRPRLGTPLRVGVEVRPKKSEKRTAVAGLAAQPNAAETLRPLRRMRLELIRSVDIIPGPEDSAAGTTNSPTKTHIHTTVLHASGKSLRYPGANAPPLRLLFTLPTAQLHPGAIATGGETTTRTPYHAVRFKVRATLGFGVHEQPGPSRVQDERGDWAVEQEITIRPATWQEPRAVVIERGLQPELGTGDAGELELVDEDEREAYRRKGRDVVGATGTTRVDGPSGTVDEPPSFGEATEEPGPSGTQSHAGGDDDNSLPTFTESEAQMRSGAVPLLNHAVPSERLVPVSFTPDDGIADVRAAQRRSSFSGELGTWIEVSGGVETVLTIKYDGYETFSVAPPPAAASYGLVGSMDPPREGDDEAHVVGDMAARLGIEVGHAPAHPAELLEQLGLNTRVVDMQDDMPPGIDEPSLPALPGFGGSAPPVRNFAAPFVAPAFRSPFTTTRDNDSEAEGDHPPSFAASEAAEAAGGMAHSRIVSRSNSLALPSDAPPPEYFGGVAAGSPHGGPPAYS
ncbi:hypothetical protein VHUM_04150 [Vanrija humicola]|uniref:Uncharacterized protein n=1 Tax=Vanrija humicola TaxID=5417 RepID=A0A7D8YUL8_VANHU|nr:hypothetical protein VHUM_04150 [Vanrija humicola]